MKGHNYSTWEPGDVVYESYAPAKHYLVLSVEPSTDNFAYPGELMLTVMDKKGKRMKLRSVHLGDYRALLEDHKRKAHNMEQAIIHLISTANEETIAYG